MASKYKCESCGRFVSGAKNTSYCLPCVKEKKIRSQFKKHCVVCDATIDFTKRSNRTVTCDDVCEKLQRVVDVKKRGVSGKHLKNRFVNEPIFAYWYNQLKNKHYHSPSKLGKKKSDGLTDITHEYLADLMINQNSKCPVFDYNFHKIGGRDNHSPTLDRIDNTKGYVIGNVMWISWRANRLKGDATIQELTRFVHFYNGLLKIDLTEKSMFGYTWSQKHPITGTTHTKSYMQLKA